MPTLDDERFEAYLKAVERLEQLARTRYGKSVLALAVRWILDQGDTIALWGARRAEHLYGVEQAMGWELDDRSKRRIDEILRQHVKDPIGPEFMAPPSRSEAALAA